MTRRSIGKLAAAAFGILAVANLIPLLYSLGQSGQAGDVQVETALEIVAYALIGKAAWAWGQLAPEDQDELEE